MTFLIADIVLKTMSEAGSDEQAPRGQPDPNNAQQVLDIANLPTNFLQDQVNLAMSSWFKQNMPRSSTSGEAPSTSGVKRVKRKVTEAEDSASDVHSDSSGQSYSESGSDSSGDDSEEEGEFSRRSNPEKEVDKDTWSLTSEQSKYVNQYASYRLDVTAKNHILERFPVADEAIYQPADLDDELSELIPGYILHQAKGLDIGARKLHYVLGELSGPLVNLWSKIDEARRGGQDSINVSDICSAADNSVIMLSQMVYELTYFRRLNSLGRFISGGVEKARKLLNSEQKYLQDEKNLFGRKFIHKSLVRHVNNKRELKKLSKELRDKKRPFKRAKSDKPERKVWSEKPKSEKPFFTSPLVRKDDDHQSRGAGRGGGHGRGKGRGKRSNPRYVPLSQFISSRSYACASSFRSRTTRCNKTSKVEERTKALTSRGQTKRICSKLETHNLRSRNPKHVKRLQDRDNRIAKKEKSTDACVLRDRVRKHHRRSATTAEQKGDMHSSMEPGPICEPHIPQAKEGRYTQTSVQPKEPEQVDKIQTLQDGRYERSESVDSTERLDGQGGPERCLLDSAHHGEATEAVSIQLERTNVCLSSAAIRSGISSKSVHQDNETGHVPLEENWNKNADILGRHNCLESECQSIENGQRFNIESATDAWVCDKLGEVTPDSNETDGISRICDRYNVNDTLVARGESGQCDKPVSDATQSEISDSPTIGSSHRTDDSFYRSNITCSPILQVHSEAENRSSESKQHELRTQSYSDRKIQSRITMVDGKSGPVQWEMHDSTTPRYDNSLRCLPGRLGRNKWRNSDTRPLVRPRETMPYKCPRAQGGRICSESVHQEYNECARTHEAGQQISGVVHNENGWNKVEEPNRPNKEPLELLYDEDNHSNRRISTRCRERRGRPTVSGLHGLEQLDAQERDLSENRARDGPDGHRSVCRSSEQPIAGVCELETGPDGINNRCIQRPMEPISDAISIPPLLADRSMPRENRERDGNSGYSDPDLEHTVMVCQTFENVVCPASDASNRA